MLTTGLKQFGHELLRHFAATLTSSQYRRRRREIKRLRSLARYQPGESALPGTTVRFMDSGSFLFGYEQIFVNQVYRFQPRHEPVTILDCGANIGLSVLYFKRLAPRCRILAFEPDPAIFQVLAKNCARLDGVELVNRAVWTAAGNLDFWAEGSDAGRLASLGERPSDASPTRVAAVRLRDYLGDQPIDLLKLDIEGAEADVLADCADRLGAIERIFLEYHSLRGRAQRLDEILAILRRAGFRLHIQPELVSPTPFVDRRESWGMDQRLNLFAYRDAVGR